MTDDPPGGDSHSTEPDTTRFWTVPNALCVGRFVGSFALLPLALAEWSYWFVGVYLVEKDDDGVSYLIGTGIWDM